MAANFGNDLKFSFDQADAPFWEEVYRQAFHDFDKMTCVRKDGWAQRGGIDRAVTTTSGATHWIDEKVRREAYTTWYCSAPYEARKNRSSEQRCSSRNPCRATCRDEQDILLEMLSDKYNNVPGWIAKELACHFIHYAVLPTKSTYLFPVISLQSAWRFWGKIWIKEYGKRDSPNEYNGRKWTTENCPVPISELRRGISQAMCFTFESEPLREENILISVNRQGTDEHRIFEAIDR